jgi:RNA polymerase sigma factor (sigma-70 family)
LIANIAVEVTVDVRKSLILRKPRRQPQRRMGVYTWNDDAPSTSRGRVMSGFDTLNAAWMVWDGPAPAPEEAVLEYTRELEKFLAEIERRDLQRRRSVRKRFMTWLPGAKEDPDNEAQDPLDNVADAAPPIPEMLMQGQAMEQLEVGLRALPARQREAFMLRNFEGLDVAETATAMGCSEGSVKTHYSRAVHALREQLGEVW